MAGADLSDGSVSGVDVNDFTIRGNDIGFNTITGDYILDGSLEVRDVAKASFAHFNATVGVVPARDCTVHPINGVGSRGDHLLLTPNTEWGRIHLQRHLLQRQHRLASGVQHVQPVDQRRHRALQPARDRQGLTMRALVAARTWAP